jgi:hypothetical protein
LPYPIWFREEIWNGWCNRELLAPATEPFSELPRSASEWLATEEEICRQIPYLYIASKDKTPSSVHSSGPVWTSQVLKWDVPWCRCWGWEGPISEEKLLTIFERPFWMIVRCDMSWTNIETSLLFDPSSLNLNCYRKRDSANSRLHRTQDLVLAVICLFCSYQAVIGLDPISYRPITVSGDRPISAHRLLAIHPLSKRYRQQSTSSSHIFPQNFATLPAMDLKTLEIGKLTQPIIWDIQWKQKMENV